MTGQDTQYASFSFIENRYARRFAESVPWRALPLYVGMVLVLAWLAFLTAWALNQQGVDPQQHGEIFTVTKYTMLLYAVLPFVYGFAGMTSEYLYGGE